MSASDSAAPHRDAHSLVVTCEAHGVDSRLLHNELEQLSNKRLHHARRLVWWSRLLTAATIAAAAACGVSVYYQRAQIYRVWRLRNPRKVARLVRLAAVCGGGGLCSLVFMISPIGLLQRHARELTRTAQLDAVAVAALVQEQNFCTLAAWAAAAAADKGTSSSVLTGTDPAPQSVWSAVVLDPTPLVHATRDSRARGDTAAATAVTRASTEAPSAADATDSRDAAAAVTRKRLESQLMRDAETASAAGGVESAASPDAWKLQPRRTWSRTMDVAELEKLFAECVSLSEGLVVEKTSILQARF
ncbi:hypothetical protein NESM_000296000 [Novymonas esmeraldas]|uniref:Uncharacterized protein n=1 Tax=Novymonas esmeraldas TaxID=1808958 RepID=A0AAW0FAV5_9TRYP